MEATKVTILPETKKRLEQVLSRSERNKLQRESVLAYLRSKPAGTLINVNKMGRMIGLKGGRLVQFPMFLQRMVRDDLITMEGRKGTEYRVFSVKADVKTTPLPATEVEPEAPEEVDTSVDMGSQSAYSVFELEERAMRYSWFCASEGRETSLQGFIKWLKSQ